MRKRDIRLKRSTCLLIFVSRFAIYPPKKQRLLRPRPAGLRKYALTRPEAGINDPPDMPDLKILCIIPARGGSQRVPGKNLAPINGKPLIAWTIEAAQSAKLVTRIIVSTNDDEIADVSSRLGAQVIIRPAAISGPTDNSESALTHVLSHLLETEGYQPDLIVFLQVTSPLRRSGDVDAAISQLIAEDADSLLSVSPTPGFIWKVEDTVPEPISFELNNRPRSQELENKFVIENGSIYVFKPYLLLEQNCRLGGKITAYYQLPISSLDIDHPEDLALVDALMRQPDLFS